MTPKIRTALANGLNAIDEVELSEEVRFLTNKNAHTINIKLTIIRKAVALATIKGKYVWVLTKKGVNKAATTK